MIELLEAVGAVASILGSILLALNNRYSRWGWVMYFIANIVLIKYAITINAMWLLSMYLVFSMISVIGIYRWFNFSVLHSDAIESN